MKMNSCALISTTYYLELPTELRLTEFTYLFSIE